MSSLLSLRRKKPSVSASSGPIPASSGSNSGSSPILNIVKVDLEIAPDNVHSVDVSSDVKLEVLLNIAYQRLLETSADIADQSCFRMVNEHDKELDLMQRLCESSYFVKCRRQLTVPFYRLITKDSKKSPSPSSFGHMKQTIQLFNRVSASLPRKSESSLTARRSSLGTYHSDSPIMPAISNSTIDSKSNTPVKSQSLRGKHSRKSSQAISLYSLNSSPNKMTGINSSVGSSLDHLEQDDDSQQYTIQSSSPSIVSDVSSQKRSSSPPSSFQPLTVHIPNMSFGSPFGSLDRMTTEPLNSQLSSPIPTGILQMTKTISHPIPMQPHLTINPNHSSPIERSPFNSRNLSPSIKSTELSESFTGNDGTVKHMRFKVVFPQGDLVRVTSPINRRVGDLAEEALIQIQQTQLNGEVFSMCDMEMLDTNGEVLNVDETLENCTFVRNSERNLSELVVRITKKANKDVPEDVLDSVLNVISIYSQIPSTITTTLPRSVLSERQVSPSKTPISPLKIDSGFLTTRTKSHIPSPASASKSRKFNFLRSSFHQTTPNSSANTSSSSILGSLPNCKFVRVELPQAVATNIMFTENMTMSTLIEKCQIKMKLMGFLIPKENVLMLPNDNDDPIDSTIKLHEHPYVIQCMNENCPPLFRLICTDQTLLNGTKPVQYNGETILDRAPISPMDINPPRLGVDVTTNFMPGLSCLTMDTLPRTPSGVSCETVDSALSAPKPNSSTVVRLILSRGVVTNMIVELSLTVAALKQKTLIRNRNLTGEVWELNDIIFSTNDNPTPLVDEVVLTDLLHVQEAIQTQTIPVFNVRLLSAQNATATEKAELQKAEIAGVTSSKLSPEEHRQSKSEASRRPRLITPEDVLRDMQIFDGPVTSRRSSLIPQSQLNPESNSPEVVMLSRTRHRPKSLCFIESLGPLSMKLTVVITPKLYENDEDRSTYSVQISLSDDSTLAVLKERLWLDDAFVRLPQPPDSYYFKYKHPEKDRYVLLLDEEQIIRTIATGEQQNISSVTLFLDNKKSETAPKTHQLNKKITSLIGFKLQQHENYKDAEVEQFRQKLTNVRLDAQHYGVASLKMHTAVDKSPLSPALVEMLSQKKFSIKFRVHWQFIDPVVKTLSCDANSIVSEIIDNIFAKHYRYFPQDSASEDYRLKVHGVEDYLDNRHRIVDHTYVRTQLMSNHTINFVMVDESLTAEEGDDGDDEVEHYIEEAKTSLGTHAELTLRGRDLSSIKWMSLWDLSMNLRVEITKAENLDQLQIDADGLFVEAGIAFGGDYICQLVRTHHVQMLSNPRWYNFVILNIPIYNIPKNARLCLTLYGRNTSRRRGETTKDTDNIVLGGASLLLVDHKGQLRQGLVAAKLLSRQSGNRIGPCKNLINESGAYIQVRFEEYTHPIVFPQMIELELPKSLPVLTSPTDETLLKDIEEYSPLVLLDETATTLVWSHRHRLASDPRWLPKILKSVKWNELEDVIEVRGVLKQVKEIPPEVALQLLDYRFEDDAVREFAVHNLNRLSDIHLLDFLLQLVQALKYESRLDSKLGRFLLTRALKSDFIGHHLFWALKSEMYQPAFSLLFALLIENYLKGNPRHLDDLAAQNTLVNKLVDTAHAVKNAPSPQRKDVMTSMLTGISFSAKSFSLPVDPKVRISEILPANCKFMDSKKLPLWMVFRPLDYTQPVHVLFKVGDDLRQDMLTLQMIRIMDRLWQADNLDLKMNPYHCVCTGKDIGFIEIVLESTTVSSIQLAHGGSTAAFKEEPLEMWIRQNNPNDEEYAKAVETFTLSCAGYCVATYCLGIGDRHNDNIMCSKRGRLFHIDFGHFLGNTKRKFGIKRERAPFVLTPDFVYVIGKNDRSNIVRFIDYCIRAYLIVRRHADMFISLFVLMLSTGIPELQSVADLQYLRDAFCLGMSEQEAADEFEGLIYESMRLGWSTQLNWWYCSQFNFAGYHTYYVHYTKSSPIDLITRVHNLVHAR